VQINPNDVAPDSLEPEAQHISVVAVAAPSRHLIVRAIPAATVGIATLAAWMQAGATGATIAALTGLICWISFDISQRKLGALAERNRRLRTAQFLQESINAVPMPIFVKDRHSRLTMINDAYCEQRHLTRAEIIGKTASELATTPEMARLIAEEDRAALNGKRIRKEETIAHPLTGEAMHQIVTKALSHTESGKPIIIGTFVDVSDIRNAEQEVRDALGAQTRLRGFLQAVLDAMPNPLFVKDVSHRYIMVNRAHTQSTGMSAETLRGKRAADLVGQEMATLLEAHEDNMLAGAEGIVYESEHTLSDRQGHVRQEILRKVVGHDPEGQRVIIGTATNITTLRHAEDELRRHRDQLKDMVEEQTVDLLRAKEEAEKANAAKSQFLANMSHELRTPMHAVLSFAQLGEERAHSASQDHQAAPEKLATYFQRIREAGDRLLDLLNDLLDLSKLEAGRMVLQIQNINLRDLVQETLHEFEASLLARQLEATILCDNPDTFAMVDPTRIAQVVRNLLSNAIKFSPAGGHIHLRLQPLEQTGNLGNSIELTVSDEGLGIPDTELEAVFDKFVQSSKTRSNAGGTGLGLPICREIINAHHGEIFARNRSPGGAEFIVRIPRQAQTESTATDAQA
jgi:PAS domain S-box-containing protein